MSRRVGGEKPVPSSTNVVNAKTNTACGLADHGTRLQCIVDTLDGVVFHTNEEAGCQLRVRRTSIEKRRRAVCEVALRHKGVALKSSVDIIGMNTASNAHKQVLRTLSRTTVDFQQV